MCKNCPQETNWNPTGNKGYQEAFDNQLHALIEACNALGEMLGNEGDCKPETHDRLPAALRWEAVLANRLHFVSGGVDMEIQAAEADHKQFQDTVLQGLNALPTTTK